MTESRKKRNTWGVEETKVLIHLWGQPDMMSKFERFTRKDALYQELSDKMAEYNHMRSRHQVREKIRNLKRDYRNTVRTLSLKGTDNYNPEENPFFADMDMVMAGRTVSDPLDTTGTSPVPSFVCSISPTNERVDGEDALLSDIDETRNESLSYSNVKPPPEKKRKKNDSTTLESLMQGFAERAAVYLEQQNQILRELKELKEKEEAWRLKEQEYREKEEERRAREDERRVREEERWRKEEERKDKMLDLLAMLVANTCAETINRSKC